MAQRPTADFNIDPNITSGTDLANILNRFQDAIDSGNSGASRPAYLDAGGLWVQTGNPMRLFFYNGTIDQEIFNTTDGVLGGIEDGTQAGQVTTWDGSAWTPDSNLIIDGSGSATFSGGVNTDKAIIDTGNGFNQIIYRYQGGNTAQFASDFDEPHQLLDITGTLKRLVIDSDGDATFSGKVNANQFVDANGPIISAFTMVGAFRKIKNAVDDETTVEGIKESLTNVLGGLIEEFESIGTQES